MKPLAVWFFALTLGFFVAAPAALFVVAARYHSATQAVPRLSAVETPHHEPLQVKRPRAH
jgi:hypothetical protein